MISDPSAPLKTVATSPWNPAFSMSLLFVMFIAIVARAVIVKQSRFEWCAWLAITLWLGVIAFREPWVQAGFHAAGVNLAWVRFMAHSCAVLGGSVLIALGVAWSTGFRMPKKRWWRTVALVYLPSFVCIAVMAVVSYPALAQNRAIEEFPSRIGLYGIVYAAMPIIGALFAGGVAARAGFGSGGHRMNGVIGAMCVFVAALSVLDHSFRILTALRTSHTAPGDLQQALEDRAAATDWLLVIPVGILLVSLMPVVVVSVANRLASSPAEGKVRQLRELWLTLMSTFPQVRLSRPAELTEPEEDLHRTLIEIEDALLLLSQWMTDDELRAAEVDEWYEAVRGALARCEGPVLRRAVVLPWSRDEAAVFELARRADMGWEAYYAP